MAARSDGRTEKRNVRETEREREREREVSRRRCLRATLTGLSWFVYVTIFIAAANDITKTGKNQSVYTNAFFVL